MTISRRNLLLGAGGLGLAAGGAAFGLEALPAAHALIPRSDGPVPSGMLGANFNTFDEAVKVDQLRRAGARWVRINQPILEARGKKVPSGVTRICELTKEFATILNLKCALPKNRHLPSPGTREMAEHLACVDTILDKVLGRINILVIGNEPFIDSEFKGDELNDYYEALARHVFARVNANPGVRRVTRLYMGALNRVGLEHKWTEKAVNRYLDFAKANHQMLDGIDLHPHVADVNQVPAFIKRALDGLHPTQGFIVTEFSLVHQWRRYNEKDLDPKFVKKYPQYRGKKVWEFYREAFNHRVGQRVWNDFCTLHDWYRAQRDFIPKAMGLFRATRRFKVATYGFTTAGDAGKSFTKDDLPWHLYSVFIPHLVNDPNALGYGWLRDFKAFSGH